MLWRKVLRWWVLHRLLRRYGDVCWRVGRHRLRQRRQHLRRLSGRPADLQRGELCLQRLRFGRKLCHGEHPGRLRERRRGLHDLHRGRVQGADVQRRELRDWQQRQWDGLLDGEVLQRGLLLRLLRYSAGMLAGKHRRGLRN